MSKINVAVVGCGRMGKMHIHHLVSFFPEINIQAVVDPNPDKAWISQYQIPEVRSNLQDIVNRDNLDAVIIAAPSSEHVTLIEQAAKAKKAIFCEKPIALSLDGIQKALRAVHEYGVKCQVGFNRRFDPSFAKVRQGYFEGQIGKLYSVRITNRDPKRPNLAFIPQSGGLFLDFNVHDFDTLRYVTGKKIEEVQAFGSNLIDPEIGLLGDIDTAIISCQLEKGGVASIDVCREALYGYDQRLELLGSKGSLEAKNQIPNTLQMAFEGGIQTYPLYPTFVERYEIAYKNQMQAFVNYLSHHNETSPAGLDCALDAVACALAAHKSMVENRAVCLQEIL